MSINIELKNHNRVEFKRTSKHVYFMLLDSLESTVLTGDTLGMRKAVAIALDKQKMSTKTRICLKTFISNGNGWMKASQQYSKRQITGVVHELKRSFNLEQLVHNFDYGLAVLPVCKG